MRTLISFLLATFLAGTAGAQDISLKWKGEVRVRGEVDGRDFQNRTPLNAFTLLRTRLGVEVIPTGNLMITIQLQDSRTFGQVGTAGPGNTATSLRNTDLRLAFLRVDSLFGSGFSLSLGRMELSYGYQRILGGLDWSNVGRVFDGALVRHQWEKSRIDLFTTNVTEYSPIAGNATPASVPGVGGDGYLFSGVYYSGALSPEHSLDAYLLHELGKRPNESEIVRGTVGAYARGSVDRFFYEAEGAYQFGDMGKPSIAAILLSGQIGLKLDGALASVMAGYDYLSGSSDTSKFKTFYAPFHTGHKVYGFMDYFINIPQNTANRGLHDLYARVVLKASESTTISIWFHNFTAAHTANLSSATFGQEIDIVGLVNYNKHLSFELGASAFLPGDLMRRSFRADDTAFWGYATTRVWF